MEEQKTFRERCKDGWERNKKKIGVAVGVGTSVVCGLALTKKWDDIIKVAGNVLNTSTLQSIQEDVSKSIVGNIAETMQETGGLSMLVLGITDTVNAKWCQITTGGRRYTCPVKIDDGEMLFRFKKVWYPVAQYVSDHADILLDGGHSMPFQKAK